MSTNHGNVGAAAGVGGSGSGSGASALNVVPQRCRLILQRCLAIQLTKPGHAPAEDFWMYDSGYMIFQNFLAANAQCWWNGPLTAATRALKYAGHIAPGMLLVTADPCALEVLRGAFARSVLKPPATYIISSVGDIDDCIVTPTVQGQFTPLPEALCDVIMDLTAEGHSATIEHIRTKLSLRFPHLTAPATEIIYDTLAQLMQEQKIYQTSKGYFIFTPERRRSRSRPRNPHFNISSNGYTMLEQTDEEPPLAPRTMLMTNAEALHSLYGEISTERDGDLTHQCIQTNLADVICGGNPNDKILYPRPSKRRSASFPTPRSLERRHSLRLFGSAKRLQRCASTRSLSKSYAQTLNTDSSSSEYQSTDSSSPKKGSLLSRLFRRSGRAKQRQIESYSAQFPPAEWFNSRAVHLHSIGTQTCEQDIPDAHTLSNSTFYDGSELSQRSSTLPRRCHRRHMSSESTFLISSRDCSPVRRRSPDYCSGSGCGSLPRSTQSIPATTTTATTATTTSSTKNHAATAATPSKPKGGFLGKHFFGEASPSRTKRQPDNMHIVNSCTDQRTTLHRGMQSSGPSSLESGRTSMLTTSGPSSIDSGKICFSKSSGHSSLDSQCSTNTAVIQPTAVGNGPRSIIVLNGSPRGTPRHQALRARAAEQAQRQYQQQQQQHQQQQQRSATPSRILEEITNQQQCAVPNSDSNNSITLQVTTSSKQGQSSLPNTKIFVQNSPVRSVITLENGKILENSNVFIINNETTMNEKGDIIKRTLSRQQSTPVRAQQQQQQSQQPQQQAQQRPEMSKPRPMRSATLPEPCSLSENDGNSEETCDSITSFASDVFDSSRYAKNVNNDNAMNNSRKWGLQLAASGGANACAGAGPLIYKNNVLKHGQPAPGIARQDFELAGSVGNLHSTTAKHSNCDLKNLCIGDELAHLLQKSNNLMGSEPNLSSKDNHNCMLAGGADKSIEKEAIDRRLSLSKEATTPSASGTNEDLYNFPSLTDLSFNFTSLAAQKILQGVNLNSMDTLVELNMAAAAAATAQEKQQNNKQPAPATPAVRTDYGLV